MTHLQTRKCPLYLITKATIFDTLFIHPHNGKVIDFSVIYDEQGLCFIDLTNIFSC